MKQNLVPFSLSTGLSIQIVPLCVSIIFFTIANPMPVPSVSKSLSLQNILKILLWYSFLMPIPESSTKNL